MCIFRQNHLKKCCFIWTRKYNLLLKPSFLKLNHVQIKHCLKNRCFEIYPILVTIPYLLILYCRCKFTSKTSDHSLSDVLREGVGFVGVQTDVRTCWAQRNRLCWGEHPRFKTFREKKCTLSSYIGPETCLQLPFG